MAGRPDPAFLNNVPTAFLSTTVTTSSFSSSSSSFSTSTSTLSIITTISSSTFLSTSSSSTSPTASTTAVSTSTPNPSSAVASVYAYVPSVSAAVVFVALFGALITYHFYLSVYNPHIRKSLAQKHTYTVPLLIACILYSIGFSVRIISVAPSNRDSITLYALSQTFVIFAPIFVCATLYLLISHLINLCLPHGEDRTFLWIKPCWLSRLFITSDILSFLLQGAGSAIAASAGLAEESRRTLGTNILILGLAAQLATFTLYLIVLTLFCRRVEAGGRTGGGEGHQYDAGNGSTKRDFGFNPLVKQVMKGVWIASILVQIRSIFRTVEFAAGSDGYLYRHEWLLWVFDATPMWLALLVLGIYHPTKWLQSKRRSWFVEKSARTATQRDK